MAGLGVLRPVLAPARALRRAARIVFPQWERARGAAGEGGAQRPAGSSAKGSPPRPAAGAEPARALQLYFLWLSGALLIIYFFSLCFIFICKLPAGLDAVHSPRCLGARRADGRRRLPGRAQPGAGQGWGTAGSGGSRAGEQGRGMAGGWGG